jgi:hypothetical protein
MSPGSPTQQRSIHVLPGLGADIMAQVPAAEPQLGLQLCNGAAAEPQQGVLIACCTALAIDGGQSYRSHPWCGRQAGQCAKGRPHWLYGPTRSLWHHHTGPTAAIGGLHVLVHTQGMAPCPAPEHRPHTAASQAGGRITALQTAAPITNANGSPHPSARALPTAPLQGSSAGGCADDHEVVPSITTHMYPCMIRGALVDITV